MPFYETHGDRPPKKFYFKSWARFQDPYFKINHDYSATIRESLRLLEYFLNSRSDCILPFSGGLDSSFLLLCYKTLLDDKRVPINSLRVVRGIYTINGVAQNSLLQEGNFLAASLNIPIEDIEIRTDTLKFEQGTLKTFFAETEYNLELISQIYFFNLFEGTILIPEGRPYFMREPWLADEVKSEKKYAVDISPTYERNVDRSDRINFFSYDRELYSTFFTEEALSFKYPDQGSGYDYKNLRHASKVPLYTHHDKFSNLVSDSYRKEGPFFGGPAQEPHSSLEKIQQHIESCALITLHEDEKVFSVGNYYTMTWADYTITND